MSVIDKEKTTTILIAEQEDYWSKLIQDITLVEVQKVFLAEDLELVEVRKPRKINKLVVRL